MKAPPFLYAKPSSLSEAFALLERYGDDAKVLAGGQSLLPALNMRLSAPAVLVDINGIRDLSGITLAGETLRVGALTRHCELEQSTDVARNAPLLAQAIPYIAHAAIRSRGTFGGSIAFADPAAELPACAVALDALLVLASAAGERRISAREFFHELYTTDLRPGELLVAGEFVRRKGARQSVFLELARRRGDFAAVGVAIECAVDGERLSDLSIVFFGVGPTPVLATHVAAALEGAAPSNAVVSAAQDAVASDIDPADEIYYTARGKLHLSKVLLARAIAQLAGDGENALPREPTRGAERTRPPTAAPTLGSEAGSRREPSDVLNVAMTVNGSPASARVPAREHLSDFLRERLGLTGSHLGCEHGVCGACTVRMDGQMVRGCLTLAAQADGSTIETIEGLSEDGTLRELQQAFHQLNAAQCGFCTPAMLITAAALVEHNPGATRDEIREYLSGNYCRCTGYQAIVDAVAAVCKRRMLATAENSRDAKRERA